MDNNTLYIVLLQVKEKGSKEWVGTSQLYTRKSFDDVKKIIEEDKKRDLTFGGMIASSGAKRRYSVRTVQITETNFFNVN